jgi:hypothetical protein
MAGALFEFFLWSKEEPAMQSWISRLVSGLAVLLLLALVAADVQARGRRCHRRQAKKVVVVYVQAPVPCPPAIAAAPRPERLPPAERLPMPRRR